MGRVAGKPGKSCYSHAVVPAANTKRKVGFLETWNPVTRKYKRIVPSLVKAQCTWVVHAAHSVNVT